MWSKVFKFGTNRAALQHAKSMQFSRFPRAPTTFVDHVSRNGVKMHRYSTVARVFASASAGALTLAVIMGDANPLKLVARAECVAGITVAEEGITGNTDEYIRKASQHQPQRQRQSLRQDSESKPGTNRKVLFPIPIATDDENEHNRADPSDKTKLNHSRSETKNQDESEYLNHSILRQENADTPAGIEPGGQSGVNSDMENPEILNPNLKGVSPTPSTQVAHVGRIVVFVDGSEESELAFRSALRCKRHDDVLYVVNFASAPMPVPPLSYDADITDLGAAISNTNATENTDNDKNGGKSNGTTAGKKVLNRFQKLVPSNEPNVIFVSDASVDPSSAAIEFAKNEHATLIVVGSRCHSTIGRVLLGSFTNYVTNNSPCDIYVVRPQDGVGEKKMPLAVRTIEEIGKRAMEAVKDKIMSTATTVRAHGSMASRAFASTSSKEGEQRKK